MHIELHFPPLCCCSRQVISAPEEKGFRMITDARAYRPQHHMHVDTISGLSPISRRVFHICKVSFPFYKLV